MSAGKYAFSKALREVRFHLCQTSQHSQTLKSFLIRAYPTMKKNNPHIPILIREAQGTEPKIWARYGLGIERMHSLKDLGDKAIEEKVKELVMADQPQHE